MCEHVLGKAHSFVHLTLTKHADAQLEKAEPPVTSERPDRDSLRSSNYIKNNNNDMTAKSSNNNNNNNNISGNGGARASPINNRRRCSICHSLAHFTWQCHPK